MTAGIFYWLGFVTLATPVISVIFGADYVQSVADMSWIAAATALRLQKTGAVTLLLASSRSRVILSGNSARLSGLAAGVIGMMVTRDLTTFLAAAAAGEAISYAMAACRASSRALSFMLPVPVLVLAAVHAQWPGADDIIFPLAGVMLAGSAIMLTRMAVRHLTGPRATLQKASS